LWSEVRRKRKGRVLRRQEREASPLHSTIFYHAISQQGLDLGELEADELGRAKVEGQAAKSTWTKGESARETIDTVGSGVSAGREDDKLSPQGPK